MSARRKIALAYREEGMTYKQIAEILEVSTPRARQLVLLAERDIEREINRHEAEKKIDWELPTMYGFKFTTLKFYCESLAERKDYE